jgi:hypothetical protein
MGLKEVRVREVGVDYSALTLNGSYTTVIREKVSREVWNYLKREVGDHLDEK